MPGSEKKSSYNKEELLAKVKEMQKQLEKLATAVMQDRFDVFVEEVNFLKTTKADKETLEEMVDKKADISEVRRKVSLTLFRNTEAEFVRNINEQKEKLTNHEVVLLQALEEVQFELDQKLDKTEIMALKDFINCKFKTIQEKLKILAQMRKDIDTAAAKSRTLRDVSCITCDADTVMRMDEVGPKPMIRQPAAKSMRPYLVYELDKVRKAMRQTKGRTINNFTDACSPKRTVPPPFNREAAEKHLTRLEHLCNRYCGGSHTTTTPQQRVTRVGHFLAEYGPQVLPACLGLRPTSEPGAAKRKKVEESPRQSIKSSKKK